MNRLLKKYTKFLPVILMLFVALLGFQMNASAQELKCEVSVMAPQVQLSDKRILESLKNDIRNFMINTKWTKDAYQLNEKIDCTILITVSAITGNEFSGTMQIQASRPVFGTNYTTPSLNVLDRNITFSYVEFQPLQYQEGSYVSELTAVLAFYANIIIGMDNDAFVEFGGNDAYSRAIGIVSSAQTSASSGWKSDLKSDKNRSGLITEIMDERSKPFRKTWYAYHRKGLDKMKEDVEGGRADVAKAMEGLEAVFKNNPFSNLLSIFFLCKKDEIINLFAQAPSSQKSKISEICQQMDVSNASKYQDKLRP